MGSPKPEQQKHALLDPILGYLNFGSGAYDAKFFANLNALYRSVENEAGPPGDSSPVVPPSLDAAGSPVPLPAGLNLGGTTTARVLETLLQRLETASAENAALRVANQSRFVLEVAYQDLLPAYLSFHQDLLFHQDAELILNPFFLGRVCQLTLQKIETDGLSGGDQLQQIDREIFSREVVARLNDFIGHRPIPTLENRKCDSHPNEWFRPVPIYLAGAGVAHGKYHELVTRSLKLISSTNPHIQRAAHFNADRLQELAIDARSFDFDHPINQRPNHHFGQWDTDSIDQDGYFHRFILHQVTLDALLDRVDECLAADPAMDREEAVTEAASALACTMLMGSGISGCRPDTFDSNTTLGTLIPVIAEYRDQFYEELLGGLDAAHRSRLLEEAQQRHQPFGAVRQDLNARLAHQRAVQLVNCRLAAIFARMGYPDAAQHQSQSVPVASARFHCEIDCLLATAHDLVEAGAPAEAFSSAKLVMDRIQRGIHCGAIVDPWNILGFDANYSLFPALENSVRDHRIYDLLDIMDRLFALLSKITSEAAACDQIELLGEAEQEFHRIVVWWRKYAAHEVSSVGAVDPEDLYDAATTVSQALHLWHKGGAAAEDAEFWRPHAELLDSPKAFSLVIDALLQRGDYQTAASLMVAWIGQSGLIPLEHGDSSFHNLMFRWIAEQKVLLHENLSTDPNIPDVVWDRIRKFYDFLEVNADDYWSVPRFEIGSPPTNSGNYQILEEFDDLNEDDETEFEDDESDLFKEAYRDMTYNGSSEDGVEGSVFEEGADPVQESLEAEVDRVLDRLEFLTTLASYWNISATIPLPVTRRQDLNETLERRLRKRRDIISNWVHQANRNRTQLYELLNRINEFEIQPSGSDHDSMLKYDQQRLNKELLLENTINTCIETENAIRLLVAVVKAIDYLVDEIPLDSSPETSSSDEPSMASIVNGGAPIVCVNTALLLNEPRLVEDHFPALTSYLHGQSPLYVPLSKGGEPAAIVNARVLQTSVLDLLRRFPANGLFGEAFELTRTTLEMERNNPVGGGAVTEFDEVFEVAYSSMVETLVKSTDLLREQRRQEGELDEAEIKKESQQVLFDCIHMLTESMLPLWLEHSKTLRLSVLEKVRKEPAWERLRDFIKTYGEGLFTQSFFHLANVRAILHQGVHEWLGQVESSGHPPDLRLFDELGSDLRRETAVRYMTIVLEAVRENFNEYVDYNTTTTQSDHGNQIDSFLDFLRLRSRYDRICWHLKPVVWAHRILVNHQENGVARMWRRSLTDRVGPEADKYLGLLQELRQKYSIQMSSVGRRLEGRFSHQLQIDRLRALVTPAMKRPRNRTAQRAFELLNHESQAFLRSTSGVGVDLPEWLAELENEVHQNLLPRRLRDSLPDPSVREAAPIPIAELREKLEQLPSNN